MFLVLDLTGHGDGTTKKDAGFVWARAEVVFWKEGNYFGVRRHWLAHFLAHLIWLAFCISSENVQEELDLEHNREF